MFEYILYAILTSNILLAGSAPSDGGYYRYIGPKWSKFARYYYPNQGYYFHYITEEESERSMRSQALTMPEEKDAIYAENIVDVATEAGTFKTLVKLVTDLGLVDTLKGVDSVTVFAPSDDAFATLPEGTLENLTTKQAKAIVARHIIVGATVTSADFRNGTAGTFGGEYIEFYTMENGPLVRYNGNDANVVSTDIKASNGVIHVLDSVIL